ncbi:hypothetical protein GGU10DRAFT_372414 [Lentinula aff. detonsa]|uniref:Uncharacterized protein n=1 Tax=Lentinula aff. detonsa TaxID=2804958 RepID=A0AA38NQE7_9AGAR|nr:hypothetical protein GGU10DRAFT_372414 [Lentinula aff. detonsa]
MFLLLWESGDQTWLPHSKIKHLQPLQEYFETLGITDISQLPPVINGEGPIEGTENLFAGSVEFLDYKSIHDLSGNISISLNHITPRIMSIAQTATFFAPHDIAEMGFSWGERKFEIARGSGIAPFVISIDEMIIAIQTSLALGRGWKIAVHPRYPEIAWMINRVIPKAFDTHLSFIAEGQLHRSQVMLTYNCFLTEFQLTTLRGEKRISGSLNKDTAEAFPKPVRPRGMQNSAGSITGAMLADFTKSDLDQSILFAGLMAHARETQRKNLWKLRKDTRQAKSTRGTQRYAISENGSQSTTTGLNAKISKWHLDSTKSTVEATTNDVEIASNADHDAVTKENEGGPSGEGPSDI